MKNEELWTDGKVCVMGENIITKKAEKLAVRIVRLHLYLREKGETVIAKQLLRAGTSIGANNSEAQCAQSKADFVAKMNIALKEANETLYLLRVLLRSGYLKEQEFRSIYADAEEVKKILVAILKSAKKQQE